MRIPPSRRPTAAAPLAAALLAVVSLTARAVRAEEATIPQLGDVTYRAELRTDARGPDADEFGGRLLAGESLDVHVSSAPQSPLYPLFEVVGPDGVARGVRIRSDVSGRSLSARKIPIDASGTWTVRVTGFSGTKGKYAVRFRVRPAPRVTVDVPADSAGAPAEVALPFEAIEGADLRLRWSWRGSAPPTIVSVRDPAGDEVPAGDGAAGTLADRAVVKGRDAEARIGPLGAGDGTYVARFSAPAGHRGFRASAEVRPAARAKGRKKLTPEEPWIAPRTAPLRVAAGLRVRVSGDGFSVSPPPRVLFGDAEGTDPSTDSYGTWVEVDAPEVPDGSTVRVAVINPDGQGFARDDFFYYVPAPTVTGVVDRSGAEVVGGSTEGGLTVRLTGTNFQSGVLVRVGSAPVIVPQILSHGLLEFRTPPHPAGEVAVRVEDAYTHEVPAPGTFEYKVPPRFGASPYLPPAAPGNLDSVVVVSGELFQPEDVVLLDGVETGTAYASPVQLAFVVPAGPSATLSVAIRDRVGTVVEGPTIQRVTITFP